jgi:hypothetical protein
MTAGRLVAALALVAACGRPAGEERGVSAAAASAWAVQLEDAQAASGQPCRVVRVAKQGDVHVLVSCGDSEPRYTRHTLRRVDGSVRAVEAVTCDDERARREPFCVAYATMVASRAAGRFDDALRALAELDDLIDDDPALVTMEGQLMSSAGRTDDASRRLATAVLADPRLVAAGALLARLATPPSGPRIRMTYSVRADGEPLPTDADLDRTLAVVRAGWVALVGFLVGACGGFVGSRKGGGATWEPSFAAPPVIEQQVVVIDQSARGREVRSFTTFKPHSLERASTKVVCPEQPAVTTQAPFIIEVHDAPTLVRILPGVSRGVALVAADGRVHCVATHRGREMPPEFNALLAPGRHELYFSVGGKLDSIGVMGIVVSPVFVPTETQLAPWIANQLATEIVGDDDLRWSPPRVHTKPMGESLTLRADKGYCYKLFLIHRPAVPPDHATREVVYETAETLETKYEAETLGWSAHPTNASCEFDAARKMSVNATYLGGGPAGDGDAYEVRVYRLKVPKQTKRNYDRRCEPCWEELARCLHTPSGECSRNFQRCLRLDGLSPRQCGNSLPPGW